MNLLCDKQELSVMQPSQQKDLVCVHRYRNRRSLEERSRNDKKLSDLRQKQLQTRRYTLVFWPLLVLLLAGGNGR